MSLHFDYVVIGGGTAGCVLAHQIIQRSLGSVAIVESGIAPRGPLASRPALYPFCFGSRWDYGYRTTPQPELMGRRIAWPRGKMLGGSSGINAMIYTRCSPRDFEEWPADWRYDQIQDAFASVEGVLFDRYHESIRLNRIDSNPYLHPLSEAFLQATVDAGYDRIDEGISSSDAIPQQSSSGWTTKPGSCIYRKQIRFGRRYSAYQAFLKSILYSDALTIFQNTVTSQLIIDDESVRAVQCVDQRTKSSFRIVGRRAVILCAGAIESPLLLQRSGVGPREVLERNGIVVRIENENVGRNLQDHLVFPIIYSSPQLDSLERNFSRQSRMLYCKSRSGPLASNLAEAGAFFSLKQPEPTKGELDQLNSFGYAALRPDIQIHFTPTHYLEYPVRNQPASAWTIGVTPLHPLSRGVVELDLKSEEGVRIDPNYLSNPRDLDVIIQGIARSNEIAKQPSLDRFGGEQLIPGKRRSEPLRLHAAVRAFSTTIYHPVATCAIGTGPQSVVDSQLQVNGIHNLYIADASVIPALPSGNPQSIVMMIAHRLAEFLGR